MRLRLVSRVLTFTLILLGMALVAPAFAATIHGTVVYPDGSPASGIQLGLYPWGGGALDLTNDYWKIPNYNFHPVTTDQKGEFVMTDVVDYPQNKDHRYILFVNGPTKFYHATTHVILGRSEDIQAKVELQKASVIRLTLKGRDGKPYTGKRAVYVQTGVLGQGVLKGVSYVIDIDFVNGVGEWGPVVLKDTKEFRGRVAILDFPNREFARAAMRERGMAMGDNEGPLRWVMKDARGRALDRSLQFVPGGVTELAFSLSL